MSPSIRSLVLALVLGAVICPAAAQASPAQMSIMMDDDLLVYRDDSTAARSIVQMKSLGVDTVRVTVLWKTVAEFARFTKSDIAKLRGKKNQRFRDAARKQNRRFKSANPRTYPTQNWDRYDNLVRQAAKNGIRVYFNVTGPGPAWAHGKPPKKLRRLRRTWKPRITEFKKFVTAVGKRYSGTYRDENHGREILPRVSMWSLWNEPNQGGWLTPQWERRKGRLFPASPAYFRKLALYGYQGLVASGHRVDNDIILLGETAPLGSSRKSESSAMAPKQFLRETLCVSSRGRLYTGNSAKARRCTDFDRKGPLRANGFAHHPYTKNLGPLERNSNPDAVTMANIGELGTMLDELSTKTGNVPSGLPLFMTEFGYETNPPDKYSGVSLPTQSKFNVLGEYLAWANPRIASQAQFLLADVAPNRRHKRNSKNYWFTYQSGLFFQRGQPKPAAYSYSFPFLTIPSGIEGALPKVSLWGQLRFRPNGRPDTAWVQWRPKDNSAGWTTIGESIEVDTMGYFTATRVAPSATPAEWRGVYVAPDGSAVTSPGSDGT